MLNKVIFADIRTEDDQTLVSAALVCIANLGWTCDVETFKQEVPQITPKIMVFLNEDKALPELREAC